MSKLITNNHERLGLMNRLQKHIDAIEEVVSSLEVEKDFPQKTIKEWEGKANGLRTVLYWLKQNRSRIEDFVPRKEG